MTTSPPQAPHERTLLTRMRRMASLIPTPWLITGGGAVLLVATAAFGGLEDIPKPAPPELGAGEQYVGSDFEMTVRSVELRDDRGNAKVFPDAEKGERVLAVTVDVVNTFDTSRSVGTLTSPSPAVDGIRVEGVAGKPEISRADDGGTGVHLQPDVPARLILAWVVGPDDISEGEELRLSLPDSTHVVGSSVMHGDYWDDVVIGAYVTAEVSAADGGGTP